MSEAESLEEKFVKIKNEVGKLIEEQLDIAEAAMNEAVNLSNKHGIPFDSSVSQIYQSYVPSSVKNHGLSAEQLSDLTGLDKYALEDAYGWLHSMIC
jgi:hypothetical protein